MIHLILNQISQSRRSFSYLFGFVFGLPLLLLMINLWFPPALYSDPACGFLVWKSWMNGACFNCATEPSQMDLAQTVPVFISWWSPGQYIFPAIFSIPFKFPLGVGVSLAVMIFSYLGIIGYYRLFRNLGFQETICLVSCLLIIGSKFFSLPFRIYNGGEVLLFGVMPWMLLAVLKWVSQPNLRSSFILLSIFLAGVFLKLSFTVYFLAICFFIWIRQTNFSELISKKSFLKAIWLAAVFVVGFLLLKYGYLNHGENPIAYEALSNKKTLWIFNFLFVLSSMFSAALNVSSLMEFILFRQGGASFEHLIHYPWLYAACLVVQVWIFWKILHHPDISREYRSLLYAFFVSTSMLFYGLIFRDVISYEERHFRLAATLLYPGMILIGLGHPKGWVRWLFSLGFILLMALGAGSYGIKLYRQWQQPVVGREYTQHLIMNEKLKQAIHQVEEQYSQLENSLVVTPNAQAALEMPKSRKLTKFQFDFDKIHDFQIMRFHGKIKHLLLIVDKKFLGEEKGNEILKMFVEYDARQWNCQAVDMYAFCYQGEDASQFLSLMQTVDAEPTPSAG